MRSMQTPDTTTGKRLLKEVEACAYVGMGRNNFRDWAKEIGARRTFGRSVMYDKTVIDKVLDSMKPAAADKGE